MLVSPNPMSSIKISTTFGAPAGAVTLLGNEGVDSLGRSPIVPLNGVAGIGNTVRLTDGGFAGVC